MINRTLIRMKVVQMLYAYLLTRSDFKFYPEPERQTVEAKASYRLYRELLASLLKLGSYGNLLKGKAGVMMPDAASNKLHNDRVVKSLSDDSEMTALLQESASGFLIDELLPEIYYDIVESAVFKNYSRAKNKGLKESADMWNTVIATIITPKITPLLKAKENFSQSSIDKGIAMLTDTLSNFTDVRMSYREACRALEKSLEKSYELYVSLLLLPVELTHLRWEQLEAARNKYLPTPEDKNPNMKFVDNRFVVALKDCEQIKEYLKDHPIDWSNELYYMKRLLEEVLSSDLYRDYMSASTSSFKDDCELWREILQDIIFKSEVLEEMLEAKNIFWNDDLLIMGSFVLKTIRNSGKDNAEGGTVSLLPMFKDKEDEMFGSELFMNAVEHREEYRDYIDRFIRADWEIDRVAFMDIVVMITAMAELIKFPAIPMPVTMKEYTDIASDYSGVRNGQFVNGLLFSVAQSLKKEGIINK